MSYISPEQFTNVTATCKANICKANIYFDGKVTSHTITLADGTRKTLGLIYPGTYKLDAGVAEVLEIIASTCKIRIAGQGTWQKSTAGAFFEVPANSYFDIEVDTEIVEYVCSYK